MWYDAPQRIRALKQMSKEKLAEQISLTFPSCLGKIRGQNANSFKLTRRNTQRYFNQGIVLVGNVAHTINPLVGQVVNRGFKGVKALV